jgi:hypothetical protein
MIDLNQANLGADGGLIWHFQQLADPRMRRGIRHNSASVLAIAACAVISGARNYLSIGEWAADLPQELLRRLGSRYHFEKRIYIPPSEPTIRRHLQSVDADDFDRIIGEWLAKQADPDAIAVDGKTLKGAKKADGKKVHLMSAILHESGVVVAQKSVNEKSNEITCFQPLLDNVDISGKVVTADAMHTQVAHANYLKEKGADYFFTAKGNQPSLHEAIKDLEPADFSPGICRDREGTRTN